MYFNRFDICEAYMLFANHYNVSGATDSPYNGKNIQSRLHRLRFRSTLFQDRLEQFIGGDIFDGDCENAAAIYRKLEERQMEV